MPRPPAVTVNQAHTFLFADLAGFTALTEAHGDERAADVAADFFSVVRGLLDRHPAREVKTIGDAIMLCDKSPADAVELGLGIVEAIDARDSFPTVRVGMSTGDAIERNGDWFGSTVNLAARISGVAGGTEVLLGEQTRAGAEPIKGVTFQRHGEITLRNIPQPVMIFRAVRAGEHKGALPVDPVCRMTVAANASAGALVHGGVEYRFCSLRCAGAFARDPVAYVG